MRAIIAIQVALSAMYLHNIYALTQCDFESEYHCEITHGAGVIFPPAALVTTWLGTDANGTAVGKEDNANL